MNGKKHYNLNITDDNGKSITTTNVSTEHPDELARILALAGVDHVESDVVVEPDCGCNEPDEFKASGVVVGDTDDFNAHHVEILDDERMMEAVDIYGNQMPDANGSVNDEDREENEVEDDDDDDEKVDIELDDDEEDEEEDKEQLNAEDEDPTDDESKEAEFKGSSAQDGDLDDYSKKTANSISRQKKHLVPGGDNALSYSESVEEIEAALIAEAKKFEEACAKKKMKEASWIDGKKQKADDMVWKSTQMSKEEAIAKYGKENVKVGMFKRGTGEEDVQVRVRHGGSLGEGSMKDELWGKAEMMDLEDFVANAGNMGMEPEEAAEFWKTANGMDESEVSEAPGDYPNVVSTKPGDGDYEKGFMYVDSVTGELYKTHPGYEVKGSYDDFVAGRGEVKSGGDFAHMSDEELQDAINDAMEQGDQGAAEEYYAELEKRSMGESADKLDEVGVNDIDDDECDNCGSKLHNGECPQCDADDETNESVDIARLRKLSGL